MDNKYRVIFGNNCFSGRSQYIIEKWSKRPVGFKLLGGFKYEEGWNRLGYGHFYDSKEDAIAECANLNRGEYVVYPIDPAA